MSKELVETKTKEVDFNNLSSDLMMSDGDTWGAGADIKENKELYKNDYLIGKIWLTQSMSELRKEGKSVEGDFCDSLTGTVLAEKDTSLIFLVVNTFKRRQTFKMNEKGKKEYVSSEMITLDNAVTVYKEIIEGVEHLRREVLCYTVMLKVDIDRGIKKAYILDFAASSKFAGRKLITDINRLNDARKPSAAIYFALTSKIESFDDGDCFVKDIKPFSYSSPEALIMARELYEDHKLHSNEIQIDDRDIIKTTATTKEGVQNENDTI